MKGLLIFDLDGTILDTVPDIQISINYMLKKFNFGQVDIENIKRFVGNGAKNLVKRSIEFCGFKLPEEKINECLKVYNDYYTASCSPNTNIFKGVKEVLFELKNRGYILTILTNKPQVTTDTVKEKYLKDLGFSMVIGSTPSSPLKPNPESAERIIKAFSAEKSKTYFIGDGETDVLTAINSSICGISVLWGYRDKETLQNAGARIFVNYPEELLKIL